MCASRRGVTDGRRLTMDNRDQESSVDRQPSIVAVLTEKLSWRCLQFEKTPAEPGSFFSSGGGETSVEYAFD